MSEVMKIDAALSTPKNKYSIKGVINTLKWCSSVLQINFLFASKHRCPLHTKKHSQPPSVPRNHIFFIVLIFCNSTSFHFLNIFKIFIIIFFLFNALDPKLVWHVERKGKEPKRQEKWKGKKGKAEQSNGVEKEMDQHQPVERDTEGLGIA